MCWTGHTQGPGSWEMDSVLAARTGTQAWRDTGHYEEFLVKPRLGTGGGCDE